MQAIAMASCFQDEWNPLLVVAPASLRLTWAEELGKWLPHVLPVDVHIIEHKRDWEEKLFETPDAPPMAQPTARAAGKEPGDRAATADVMAPSLKTDVSTGKLSSAKRKRPKVVVISYRIMSMLWCAHCRPILKGEPPLATEVCPGFPHCSAPGCFPFVIVDEAHKLQTNNTNDSAQTVAVRQAVRQAKRAVLLTGTPSVSRPFDLIGQLHSLMPHRFPSDFEKAKIQFAFRCALPS